MAKRVLIIGAGEAGEMVAREMLNHPEAGLLPVGFIDDDPKKNGRYILGIKVIGGRDSIRQAVVRERIDEILIAIPSARGQVIRDLIAHCKSARVEFKIVPGILEIIKGDVKIDQIREVHPEDLLGRQTVTVDMEAITAYLAGERVLVTGAGGSIGAELCRQVARFEPELIILLEHEEDNIYQIKRELEKAIPLSGHICIIGDVRDRVKISKVFNQYKPRVIFHAAAYKHLPLMEENVDEAVKNNVFGTKIMAEMAFRNKVDKFIMISTDKAVNPTSVLGASKRVAELVIQDLARMAKETRRPTKFMIVRFGNVLGSRGSVVPLFKRQIQEGGPVTVTHPEVTRFFMTIPEAAQLVIQAGALGEGGEVFLLDMGEQVKILQLAQDLITLSGLEPSIDIKIEFIGLRPGEKLYEELLTRQEGVNSTRHEKIFVSQAEKIDSSKLHKDLDELRRLSQTMNREGIIRKLKEMVPNYKPIS